LDAVKSRCSYPQEVEESLKFCFSFYWIGRFSQALVYPGMVVVQAEKAKEVRHVLRLRASAREVLVKHPETSLMVSMILST
jgi:hypothetical protein